MERLALILNLLFKPNTALAAKIIDRPGWVPTGPADVTRLLGAASNFLLSIAGISAVAMIIWGATQYLTSGGNPEKAAKGKTTLTWAFIGMAVIIGAAVLVNGFTRILAGTR